MGKIPAVPRSATTTTATVILATAPARSVDLYIKGGFGGNVVGESDLSGTNVTTGRLRFDLGFSGAAAVGTKIGPFRVELEGSYGISPASELDAASISSVIGGIPTTFVTISGVTASGDLHTTTAMANAYWDFSTPWPRFSPFVGGGFGLAYVNADNIVGVVGGASFPITSDSDLSMMYQVSAGFSYTIAPTLALELSYRFLSSIDALGISELNFDDAVGGSFSASFHQHRVMLALRYYL